MQTLMKLVSGQPKPPRTLMKLVSGQRKPPNTWYNYSYEINSEEESNAQAWIPSTSSQLAHDKGEYQ